MTSLVIVLLWVMILLTTVAIVIVMRSKSIEKSIASTFVNKEDDFSLVK